MKDGKAVKTNLIVFFSSEGASPSEVTEKLAMLNFIPTKGSMDYVYIWDHTPSVDEIIELGDRINNVLKGTKIMYNIVTE